MHHSVCLEKHNYFSSFSPHHNTILPYSVPAMFVISGRLSPVFPKFKLILAQPLELILGEQSSRWLDWWSAHSGRGRGEPQQVEIQRRQTGCVHWVESAQPNNQTIYPSEDQNKLIWLWFLSVRTSLLWSKACWCFLLTFLRTLIIWWQGAKNTEHFCLVQWTRSMLITNQLQMESEPTKKHFIYKN